jgi:hypothetical protein
MAGLAFFFRGVQNDKLISRIGDLTCQKAVDVYGCAPLLFFYERL